MEQFRRIPVSKIIYDEKFTALVPLFLDNSSGEMASCIAESIGTQQQQMSINRRRFIH
jgi:hypothetical protein